MIETEESKQVSNKQLSTDIFNTEREQLAYKWLADGFLILSELPENQGIKSSEYFFNYRKYSSLEKECSDFSNKLLALKKERGL